MKTSFSKYHHTKGSNSHNILSLVAATGEEVRFTYLEDKKKVAASVVNLNDNKSLKILKNEDMPKELKAINDSVTLKYFLANAYAKVSTLDNGDMKLYVNQKGLGGGKEDRNLLSWNKLLMQIKNLEEAKLVSGSHSPPQLKTPLKAFISYAWEETKTPEGRIENSKLQLFLENLRDDLQSAGVSVFLDIRDMTGNMSLRMEEALKTADVIIPVVTPRFLLRAKAVPQTNLGFEYKLTLEKAKDIPYGILPIHYKGSFDEAFGEWGALNELNELKELKGFLVRDCTKGDNDSDILVATQSPLGIIPTIYKIDFNSDREYSNLINNWRYAKLTRLAPRNHDFTGREELLEKIADSLSKVKGESVINQKQTISGLGGVGKTELALEYSHKYGNKYIMKRWIASEGINLKLEFEQMVTELGIDSKALTTDSELARSIYKKLGNIESWLLVFDNAEDYQSLPPRQETKQGQHILITSRSQQWKNGLSVDTFTKEEAWQYISKELPSLSEANKEQEAKTKAENLAKAVGHLPLALSHTVAYINQTGMSINSYLKLYQQKGIELFDTYYAIEDSSSKYPISLLQTMKLSFEKIKAQSPFAAKMLTAAAYLSPDNIPKELFATKSLLGQITEVNKALVVLRNYSLIEPSKIDDHIQIHRLVQEAVRHTNKQDGNKETEQLLIDIAAALNECCPWDKIKESDFAEAKILLPHMSSVIQSLGSYATVTYAQENKSALSQSDLLFSAAHTYQDFGNYRRAKELYEKALVIKEKHYGKDHPEVASILFNLSFPDEALGNKEAALQEATRAHKIFSSYLGYENHPSLTLYTSRVEKLKSKASLMKASNQKDKEVTDAQSKQAEKEENKQNSSKSSNKKSSDCIVCKADQPTYDNELLNYSGLFSKAAKAFGINKSLELGKVLSPDLIDQAAATNDLELLIAGATSLDHSDLV